MTLSDEVRELLRAHTTIVGFADLRCLPVEVRRGYEVGIVIGLPNTKQAMLLNNEGLPQTYFSEYHRLNEQLTVLANLTASFLREKGYDALAETRASVTYDTDYRSLLPYKTVATLAGLGWIGKSATLVTRQVGSALRVVVVLTTAELDCGTPITASRCPSRCTICIDQCPGQAIQGGQWVPGSDRSELVDAQACQAAARSRAMSLLGVDETICGLCISHCPFTKRGLVYVSAIG